MTTLLCHHTHTPWSNTTTRKVQGFAGINHYADYVEVSKRLPEDIDIIFTRTDHWRASRTYVDHVTERARSVCDSVVIHSQHVTFECGGTRVAIINGVEAALEDEHCHVTICGLPHEDGRTYHTLTIDELIAAADQAAWIAPAHPFLPLFSYSRDLLCRLLRQASDSANVTIALGYPTGYIPTLNHLSRGSLFQRGESVQTLADEFDVPLLPELDWHVALPESLQGFGVIPRRDVLDQLIAGDIPTETILDCEVKGTPNSGMSFPNWIKTFPDVIPGYSHRTYDSILPRRAKEFQRIRDASLAKIGSLDRTDLSTPKFDPENLS